MAAATLPIPLADLAAVTLVQIDLVQKLADRFDVEVPVGGDGVGCRHADVALAHALWFGRPAGDGLELVCGQFESVEQHQTILTGSSRSCDRGVPESRRLPA